MKNLNALQTISLVGLIFSVVVQAILFVINKHIDTLWALYPTWICVFIIGLLIKKYVKEEDHHHH